MAHDERDTSDQFDESADTASFQRFMEQEGQRPASGAGTGRGFRLASLAVGAVILIAIVVLLLQ
ncbi:MAG TPA: hypothetical protein VK875_09745 [Euzebyales bacterium]|nr:hypothetical protein [Euzebyales bacterium]